MTKTTRFCSGDTILEVNPIPSASKPNIILPSTAILNPFSVDFNMLIGFRCPTTDDLHRGVAGPLSDHHMIRSVLSPPVLVAKYSAPTDCKAFLRFMYLWKVWGGCEKIWYKEEKLGTNMVSCCHAHMSLVHFFVPPCNKAVLKNYQTKQRQL